MGERIKGRDGSVAVLDPLARRNASRVLTPAPASAAALLLAAGIAAETLLVLRFSFHAPGVRVLIESLLAGCALATAWWLTLAFRRQRRTTDLLTLLALVGLACRDLVFFALPAVADSQRSPAWLERPELAGLLVACLFLLAAHAPQGALVPRGRASWAAAGAIGLTLLAGAVVDLPSHAAGRAGEARALAAAAVLAMVASAAGFAGVLRGPRRSRTAQSLGGASILLAGAWSYDLVVPGAHSGAVSGRDLLRALAYGLILGVGLRTRNRLRREDAAEIARGERQRLARDLHDGMVQDLAFIAACGAGLSDDLGPRHPMVVAARRALEASRGALVELSQDAAADGPGALRAVARELSERHRVQVTVEADDAPSLPPAYRRELVHITREAILNAVEHGGARSVLVDLRCRDGAIALTIRDDGRGRERTLTPGAGRGLGIRTMRERAEEIGGRLRIEWRDGGGTTVRVDA